MKTNPTLRVILLASLLTLSAFVECVRGAAPPPLRIVGASTRTSPNFVEVLFTAPVDPVTATNPANYSFNDGSAAVTGAGMGSDGARVVLTTSGFAAGTSYWLTVANVLSLDDPPQAVVQESVLVLRSQGAVTRKVFLEVYGSGVQALLWHGNFPDYPNTVTYESSFEAPANVTDQYGLQMAGYVYPPKTGDYVFYLAGDEAANLYLSSDESPGNKVQIAKNSSAVAPRGWNDGAAITPPESVLTPQTLFIESEDFDYGAGEYVQGVPIGMDGPYSGDAFYNYGTEADLAIDWNVLQGCPGPSPLARPYTCVPTRYALNPADLTRGWFDVLVNYTVGWNTEVCWYNYTREFPSPAQDYYVYARLASDVSVAARGRLDAVTGGVGTPLQTTLKLGEFNAPPTGGWDTYVFVPLTDDAGAPVKLNLGGRHTLRYSPIGGVSADHDYFAFVPAANGLPPTYPENVSDPIHLVAGQRYYLEALMKENYGADHLAVAWRLPEAPAVANGDPPIPGVFLSSLQDDGPVVIVQQPADLSVPEMGAGAFVLGVQGAPPYQIQWYKNEEPIPGANQLTLGISAASYADNGARYRAEVANLFSVATSAEATLTVAPDLVPPLLSAAVGSPTWDEVTLKFDSALEPGSAENPANYLISGGVSVTGARLLADQARVLLTTSPQTPGAVYTVTVNHVTDTSYFHNPIAPNTQGNFTAWIESRNFLLQEMWSNLPGNHVADLTSNPRFPADPDWQGALWGLEAYNLTGGVGYGQRLSGWLLPPTTGNYVFAMTSSSAAEFYLSTDDTPAQKIKIAENLYPITFGAYQDSLPEIPDAAVLTPETAFVEAEDFDYGHGQYVQAVEIGMHGPYAGGAYAGLGLPEDAGIDFFEMFPPSQSPLPYRPETGVEMIERSTPEFTGRGAFSVTVNHVMTSYELGDWRNYTREFPQPNRPYNVFARVASTFALTPAVAFLDEVIAGAGTPIQSTVPIGQFHIPPTGDSSLCLFVPLVNEAGDLVTVTLGGQRTLRYTVIAGSHEVDYLAFVPVGDSPPTFRRSNFSDPIPLVGGQRYYLEVLHKAAYAITDTLAVTWQRPGGPPIQNWQPTIPQANLMGAVDPDLWGGYVTPWLERLEPAYGTAGQAGFTLTLHGQGFLPGASVTWNGQAKATTYVDSRRLTAEIDAADLGGGGDFAVALVGVTNPSLRASNPQVFPILGGNISAIDAGGAEPGQGVTVCVPPTMAGDAGVCADVLNGSGEPLGAIVAQYVNNPTPVTLLALGGRFMDFRLVGTRASATATGRFYYPSTVVALDEDLVQLLYFNGSAWVPVLSAGGTAPAKDPTDNLEATISGGRVTVAFDLTSTPKVSELTGTVFAFRLATGPLLLSAAGNCSGGLINLRFDRTLDPVSASQPANYRFDGGVTVVSAALQPDQQGVWLGTDLPLVAGTPYHLSVINVADALGNAIALDSQVLFQCDGVPPALVSVQAYCGGQKLTVQFSEPLDPATATIPENYSLSGGLTVIAAGLLAGNSAVELTFTGNLASGATGTLTVANVADATGNPIPPGSQITVTCEPPPPVLHLGGKLWLDANGNGLRETGELLLPRASLTLWTDDGDGVFDPQRDRVYTSTTTDFAGDYWFSWIPAATYFVQVLPVSFAEGGPFAETGPLYGLMSSPAVAPADADVVGDDNGVDNAYPAYLGVVSTPIHLFNGTEPDGPVDGDGPDSNHTVDFGFYPPAEPPVLTIGDLVWDDTNFNGVYDIGEPGLQWVRLTLYADDGDGRFNPATDLRLGETWTYDAGWYHFGSLPAGQYFVYIDPENFRGEWPALLAGYTSVPGYGLADADINNDDSGVENGPEFVHGIASSVITLAHLAEPGMEADGDGENSNLTIDFGFAKRWNLVVGGLLFRDQNNDGSFQPELGEARIDNVRVELWYDNGNGVLDTGDTYLRTQWAYAGAGVGDFANYSFSNLAPGDYLVRITPDHFWPGQVLFGLGSSIGNGAPFDPNNDVDNDSNGYDVPPGVGPQGAATRALTLTAGGEPITDGDGPDGNLTLDFGFYERSGVTVGNLVFRELNNNGRFEPELGEYGVDGVPVELYADNGDGTLYYGDTLLATTYTSGGGYYQFSNLPPGNYIIALAWYGFTSPGQPFYGWHSSGSNDAVPDPNNDVDNDDNGLENTWFWGLYIHSKPVTLTLGGEPDLPVDGDGPDSNLTVDFGLVAPNQPPIAGTDDIQRKPGQAVKIPVAKLLANDYDPEAGGVTLVDFGSPWYGGTLTRLNADWLLYQPSWSDWDLFTYTIVDPMGLQGSGVVYVSTANSLGHGSNLLSVTVSGNDRIVKFAGIPGRTYTIEYTPDLIYGYWQPLGTAACGPTGIIEFTDPNPPDPVRFYRTVYP